MATITVWILGDQLLFDHPALVAAEKLTQRPQIRVVLIESAARIAKRWYHRQKLVLLLSAMRHFAQVLRGRGYQVDYIQAASIGAGLRQHVSAYAPTELLTMAAAEFNGRQFQEERLSRLLGIPVTVLPKTQFLAGQYDPFPATKTGTNHRVVMENFYRALRRHFKVLIEEDGSPVGGAWNFDRENRKPLPKGGLHVPLPVSFAPDPITAEVIGLVEGFENAIGAAAGFDLAVTHADANAACPFNLLYWNFLLQHEERLRATPRSGPAVLGLRHPSETERREIPGQVTEFLESLGYDG